MPEDHLNVQYPSVTFNADVFVRILQPILSFFGVGSHVNATTTASATMLGHYDAIASTLYMWWQVYSIFAFILSALFLYGIIYARIRLGELFAIIHKKLHHEEMEYKRLYERHAPNNRTAKIDEHAASENPNDWRIAIIEADILLDEMLDEHGFHGLTLGEKLKGASLATLHSLDDAWSAHKVRNEIAHTGGDFILTKKIAHDALARYRKVFAELGAGDHEDEGGGHH
jgi:hypothetical protein